MVFIIDKEVFDETLRSSLTFFGITSEQVIAQYQLLRGNIDLSVPMFRGTLSRKSDFGTQFFGAQWFLS